MMDGLEEILGFFFLLSCAALAVVYVVLRLTGAHPLTAFAKGIGL